MDPHPERPSEMTLLCERLSERLARDGAPHPRAAAIALAVRGLSGSDVVAFAEQLGISGDEVARAESGEVPFAHLPAGIVQRAVAEPRLDLDRLRLANDPFK